MVIYSERLVPGFGLHLALLLLLPLGFGMLAPIDVTWGIVNAIVVYAIGVSWLTLGAPKLVVTSTHFRAGRAEISREHLGEARVIDVAGRATAISDARAWKVLRAWIPGGVQVAVTDTNDPAPYWYVSSRHPEQLVAALRSN